VWQQIEMGLWRGGGWTKVACPDRGPASGGREEENGREDGELLAQRVRNRPGERARVVNLLTGFKALDQEFAIYIRIVQIQNRKPPDFTGIYSGCAHTPPKPGERITQRETPVLRNTGQDHRSIGLLHS